MRAGHWAPASLLLSQPVEVPQGQPLVPVLLCETGDSSVAGQSLTTSLSLQPTAPSEGPTSSPGSWRRGWSLPPLLWCPR